MVAQHVFHRASSHRIIDLWRFADRCNIPWNLPTNFHPDLIETIRQRCLLSLCALLSQQSHLFLICVVWTCNDSRRDLHRICRIPRNCPCKWLVASCRAPKNFCKLLWVSWEVFVLHGYAWIHWVAKSCTTTANRWLFRDSQLSLRTLWSAAIKSPTFSARGTAPPLRLLHGALVILVLWQISQFRSLGKWVSTLCLHKSSRLLNVGSKDTSWEELAWVSMFWNFVIHQIFSDFSQPLRDFRACTTWVGKQRVDLFPLGFLFYLFFDFYFLFAWSISGRPDLSSTVVDTVTGEMSLSVRSSLSRVWTSLSVGDEDELEEDVEQWLSCLEGVFEVDEDPEDESDKPGTTIGTKFSVLHCIRIPFLNEMWFFYHWSIHKNIRFHRKAIRATILLACFRGLS